MEEIKVTETRAKNGTEPQRNYRYENVRTGEDQAVAEESIWTSIKSTLQTPKKVIIILCVLLGVGIVVGVAYKVGGARSSGKGNRAKSSSPVIPRTRQDEPISTCTSPKCKRTAASFLQAMDSRVNPCDDFYQFACGKWAANTKGKFPADEYYDQSRIVRKGINEKLIELTEAITSEDIAALQNVNRYYEACKIVETNKLFKGDQTEVSGNSSSEEDYGYARSTTTRKPLRLTASEIVNNYKTAQLKCVLEVNNVMPFALTHKYLWKYVEQATVTDARDMVTYLQSSFREIISGLDWMDMATKRRVTGKFNVMPVFVGYSEWMKDPKIVDSCYEGLQFTGSNLLNLLLWLDWVIDMRTGGSQCPRHEVWNVGASQISPAMMNAAYLKKGNNIAYNSVFIPAGILQAPYFDMGLKAADYGSLGILVGHEITHGFDSTAESVNSKDISEMAWWSTAAQRQYNKTVDCISNQYRRWLLPELASVGLNHMIINATQTLDENLADNGGLRISYEAYKAYAAKRGKPEQRLPGLERYTSEQIFFLSFAHSWCTSSPKSDLIDTITAEDGHSPNTYRVFASLSNFEEFSTAWNCPRNSRMNPANKCALWG